MSNQRTVGVALSGGGHRAGAWALGALLYLHDAGVAPDVKTVASVSGGSITSAWLAARLTWSSAARGDVYRATHDLAQRYATHGTVFADREAIWLRRGLPVLAVLVVLALVAVLIGALLAPFATWAAWLAGASTISLMFLLLSAYLALRARRDVVVRAYARRVCEGLRMRDLPSTDEHVFCATDVQLAQHVYLAKKFVYAFDYGVGTPGDLSLASVLAASAGFPFAFAPQVFARQRFGFEAGWLGDPPESLHLLDGGIYDNMAEQWVDGMPKRLREKDANAGRRAELLTGVCAVPGRPTETIVVNASPSFPASKIAGPWPISELRAWLRTVLAMHDNSTALRRRYLFDRFRRAEIEGTMVHIGTDPWADTIVPALDGDFGPEAAARAAQIEPLIRAAGDAATWKALREETMGVGTTLDPLGVAATASLMQHAYALAAVQTCVHLGRPPVNDPAAYQRSRFIDIVKRPYVDERHGTEGGLS